MKKLFILMLATVCLLLSCNQVAQPNTKSTTQDYTFTLDDSFVQAICRTAEEKNIENSEKLRICLEILCDTSGDYCITQENIFTMDKLKNGDVTFTIQRIPVDAKFSLKVSVFIFGDELIYEGQTKEQTLKNTDDTLIEDVEVKVKSTENNDYILFKKNGDSVTIATYKPQDVLSAKQDDFPHITNTETYEDETHTRDEYTQFLDAKFDAQGNLWVIMENKTVESPNPDYEVYNLYKKLNDEYVLISTQENPYRICIDEKTNTLLTLYEVIDTTSRFYVNTYDINSFDTVLENKQYYEPTKTIECSKMYTEFYPESNPNIKKTICIEAYSGIIFISYTHKWENGNGSGKDPTILSYAYTKGMQYGTTMLPYPSYTIKDMTAQDDNLYVLFDYQHMNGDDKRPIIEYDDQFNVKGLSATSKGCVTKFSINPNPNLEKNETVITKIGDKGLVTKTDVKNITFSNIVYTSSVYDEDKKVWIYTDHDVYSDYECTTKATVNVKLTTQYPSSSQSLEFFGPQKFVALRPKKLIIQDNGMFVYQENDEWFYKSVNRLVTVDLETFAITNVQDINVDFGDLASYGDSFYPSGSLYYQTAPSCVFHTSSIYLTIKYAKE